MSPQAVDYSFSHPNPHDLAAAGYVGAMRYLSNPPNAKIITADEVASLHANNLAIGLVFEGGVANAIAGAAQGTRDGMIACAQADALGFPLDRPIYFAVDTDAQTIQFDAIDAYGRAFGAETHRPVGVYGSWTVVESMLDRGVAAYAWQTVAWSHGKRSSRAHLYQRADVTPPPGCDVNDILADDWGQWPLTQGADDMALSDEDKAFITQTVADQVTKIIHDSGVNGAADPRVNGANTVLDALANVAKQVAQPAGSTTLHGDVPLSGTLHFG